MNKKLLIIIFIISTFIIFYLGLSYSSGFNGLIFSEILNSYDPLQSGNGKLSRIQTEIQDYWEDPRCLFPIFAYNLPDSSKDLVASLRIIENGGINIVINSNLGWIADANRVKEAFEKLEDSQLMWLVLLENECNDDYIFGNTNDETNNNIKNYLKNFDANYVYGWHIWDEPGKNRKPCSLLNLVPNDDFSDINNLVKQIRSDSIFNKKLDFVNLFPTYWDGTPDAESYEKYIDTFIASQEFKPRVLCFDHYPLLKDEFGGFRKNFYSNLNIISNKSLEYNIPFWMIVLSSEHDNYKSPTIEEISFQVYSALAYGAKGLGYYLYSKGWEKFSYKSWILEDNIDNDQVLDSMHGPLYKSVQALNKNIQTIGKILLNLKFVEVIHTSDFPNNQIEISSSIFNEKLSNRPIKSIKLADDENSDPKVLVGIFEENNKTSSEGKYLLIVSKDLKMETDITLTFNKNYDLYRFDNGTGEKGFIKTGSNIIMGILPGSGELLYFE